MEVIDDEDKRAFSRQVEDQVGDSEEEGGGVAAGGETRRRGRGGAAGETLDHGAVAGIQFGELPGMKVQAGLDDLDERPVGDGRSLVAAADEDGGGFFECGTHLAQKAGLSHAGLCGDEDDAGRTGHYGGQGFLEGVDFGAASNEGN
jgi:hypothetical protein